MAAQFSIRETSGLHYLVVNTDIGIATPDSSEILNFAISNLYHDEIFATEEIAIRGLVTDIAFISLPSNYHYTLGDTIQTL